MAKPNVLESQDAALIAACRRGEDAAWATLVERYQKLIYTIPRRAGLDDEQCADIFQLTFQRLFEHLDQLEQPERVRAWLVTTARRATDRMKERADRWQPLPEDDQSGDAATPLLPDPAPLPDALIVELEEQHLVRTTMAQLDARCQELLSLLFYTDDRLAYSDIAGQLKMPEGSIGPTRNRCLKKLRDLLKEVGFACIFLQVACSV